MNSNNKDKVKNFFRKEGFYFVLFICLCVIATVAVVTINKNNAASKNSNEEISLDVNEGSSLDQSANANNENIQNAERAESDSTNVTEQVAEAETEEVAEVEEVDEIATESVESTELEEVAEATEGGEAEVMSGTESGIIFSLPLEGTVNRSYGEMIEVKKTDNEQIIMTRRGVDLQATMGSVVKSAAEGQVQEVGSNSEDGNYIVIAHANGLKTKYANLDPEVYVSEGDMITEGQELGVVGNSSLVFTSDICGDVLNLQVEDANGKSVDPSNYFNF